MAKDEHDREDLLAEAKALVERISLRVANQHEVVVGFRRDHSASFFLDPERVYQFTSDGRLRRAYVGGLLYKGEQGRLVSLTRRRTESAVELLRHTLSEAETKAFLRDMRWHLDSLHQILSKHSFHILGQIPADADLVSRIGCWLDEFVDRARIADSPRAR